YFKKQNINYEVIDFYKFDLTNRPNSQDFDVINLEDKIKGNFKAKAPRLYQQEILNKLKKYYELNQKGKLILPCGSGKTLISYWLISMMNYKKVLFLVPSLYLLSQVGDVFLSQSLEEGKELKHLFVGSDIKLNEKLFDTDTINMFKKNLVHQDDKAVIKKFYNTTPQFIIFSTYQSSMALNEFQFDFIVCDESHKTTVQNENETGFNNYVKNHNEAKKIFLTATEKICNIKDDDIEDEMSMDNETLYGKLIHRMSIRQAINENALCNYEVVVHQDDINSLVDENKRKELKQVYKFNKIIEYYGKAMIIKKFIEKYNPKHIITKHNLIDNAKIFSKILTEVLNDIDVEIFTLDGNASMQTRKNIINKFKRSSLSIICQAKVLSEGVDIPEIDTAVIIDDIDSTIDIIQFIGRCLRLLQGKDKAYVLLPMLVDKNKDIINVKREFNNIRIILRAMAYEDDRIVQYFANYDFSNNTIDEVGAKKDIINFENTIDMNPIINTVKDLNKISPETFEKAKNVIRSLNIKSIKNYKTWCNERTTYFNIPSNPDIIYKTLGWVNWTDWLGHKILELKDIKNLIEKVNIQRMVSKEKSIDTKELYDIFAKDKGIPTSDELDEYYNVEYKWLFSIDKKQYLSWTELSKCCKEFYEKNKGKYGCFGYEYYKQMIIEGLNAPNDPNIYYKEFTNYDNLFNIINDYE
ncbi:superfamily II helicase, partial [Klosneuvirus KNV1]